MLQNENIIYEEGEFIPSKALPGIITKFIVDFIHKAESSAVEDETLIKMLANLSKDHNYFTNPAIMQPIIEEYLLDTGMLLEEYTAEQLSFQQLETLKELNKVIDLAGSLVNEATTAFHSFNDTYVETDGELYTIATPALRICQIPGCGNELHESQHHAAKYCTSCHASGAVKKHYNLRHKEKVKHLTIGEK